MKLRRKNSGFTLIELMVTIASSSVLILTAALILFITYREWRIDNAYAQLRRDVSLAVQLIAQDIRESAVTDITTVAETSLSLGSNPVRPDTHTFIKAGDTLRRDINSASDGLIITKGLQRFSPVETNKGVLLHFELANDACGIAITNETFILTRN